MHKIHPQKIETPFQVAIVTSRFNEDITNALYDGAISRLLELGIPNQNITSAWVPGAIEIPIAAQRFALLDRISVVITLGAVIKGETHHYEYVCEQVNNGCQRVALDSQKPVVFGVLTTLNKAQALARVGGEHGHYGRYSADCAYEMVSVLAQVE